MITKYTIIMMWELRMFGGTIMETVTIKIENCNNIVNANIKLEKESLNIKFGYNGTGKTTIGKAIMVKASDESQLSQFLPYAQEGQEEAVPRVDDVPFQKVRVFNEEYSDRYLFRQDSIFEDSYKVLLRSKECEDLANEISDLLYGLQNTSIEDTSMGEVLEMLNEYVTLVKYANGNITRRGGVGEFLKGNGAGFDKYDELKVYRPFYEGKSLTDVTSWATWRTKGIERMGNEEICPFCADKLNTIEIQKKNNTIKKVFKSSALKTAGQIIEYIRNGIEKGYIAKQSEKKLEGYIGDSSKSDELEAELGKLAAETEYLLKKLQRIQGFRPMNVTQNQLDHIDESLRQMQIEMDQLTQYYDTTAIRQVADAINTKVCELMDNTGKLRGLFKQYDKKMEVLIDNRKEDINYFFTLAGFPYEFEIRKDGENKASTFLTPVGNNSKSITKPNSHLSWGERNAFSLVMFMFDAVSDDADLIVLDDPISSFDVNKKFAIIKRLFDNKEVSFRGKTVLMLTHDLQPVIDYVHGGFFKQYHIPVKADYIENEKGIIREKSIEDTDLLNIVNLTEQLTKDPSQPLHVRIIN